MNGTTKPTEPWFREWLFSPRGLLVMSLGKCY